MIHKHQRRTLRTDNYYGIGAASITAQSEGEGQHTVRADVLVDDRPVPEGLSQGARAGRSLPAPDRGSIGEAWRSLRKVSKLGEIRDQFAAVARTYVNVSDHADFGLRKR